MYKALVIGLGMGQQYRDWLTELNYDVKTVDTNLDKNADYLSVNDAIEQENFYDIIYIGTPNWTHELIARQVVNRTKILLIEKPGFLNSKSWKQLILDNSSTRIMMVKNNQYRQEISEFKNLASISSRIFIKWNNRNRIPHPGSWFTTKSKSFGGVSRDLIPHMLSYYCALTDYKVGTRLFVQAQQKHQLEHILDSDYGIVDHNGIYDVDDFCEIEFKNKNINWILTANWKNNQKDDSSINFDIPNIGIKRFELGLCPKEAYQNMITTAVSKIDNDDFWQDQLEQDVWIHQQIENL